MMVTGGQKIEMLGGKFIRSRPYNIVLYRQMATELRGLLLSDFKEVICCDALQRSSGEGGGMCGYNSVQAHFKSEVETAQNLRTVGLFF